MIKEALQYLNGLKPIQQFSFTGKDNKEHAFTTDKLHEIQPAAPELPAKVNVQTLAGFGDLITEAIDGLDKAKFVIHIEAFDRVSLIAKDTDVWGRRTKLIEATPVKFTQFKFGEFEDQADFIIGVMSLFSSTSDRDYIVKLAGAVTLGNDAKFEDNGLTQTVTVKKGQELPELETLKPLVDLAPYRTFPEANQPISKFLFRCDRGDSGPVFALYEADGGLWKVHAIDAVRRFLATLNLGIEIVA